MKAKGVIYGEQERSVIGSCGLEERMLQSTGNIKKQIALVWKGHELILHGPKTSPYPYSCQQIKTTRLLGVLVADHRLRQLAEPLFVDPPLPVGDAFQTGDLAVSYTHLRPKPSRRRG